MKLDKLTPTQEAIAELVATKMEDTGRPAAEVARALCGPGGKLHGHYEAADVMHWHRHWSVREMGERRWAREQATDPEDMETMMGGDVRPTVDTGTLAGAIAGQLLEFMDHKLLAKRITWQRTATSLCEGDSWRQETGPGRMTIRGIETVWGAYAVVKERAGRAIGIYPECIGTGFSCCRGRRRLLMIRPSVKEQFSPAGMAQMTASLLLLFKNSAGGLTTHAAVADAVGMSRANGSHIARGMAKKIVATGGIAGAAVIRRRETLK